MRVKLACYGEGPDCSAMYIGPSLVLVLYYALMESRLVVVTLRVVSNKILLLRASVTLVLDLALCLRTNENCCRKSIH